MDKEKDTLLETIRAKNRMIVVATCIAISALAVAKVQSDIIKALTRI